MAQLKTNFVDGDAIIPGSTGGTNGLNATNDRVNIHTHDGTDTVALNYTRIMYSTNSGTTAATITGNGTAQNVFSKTFASGDWVEGDLMRITLYFGPDRIAGSDTPDIVLSIGGTTIWTEVNITSVNRFVKIDLSDMNTSSNNSNGFLTTMVHNAGTTGDVSSTANVWNMTNSTVPFNPTAFGSSFDFKLTIDPATSTNYKVPFSVFVEKVKTGVS